MKKSLLKNILPSFYFSTLFTVVLTYSVVISKSFAFNSITHGQILSSSFDYIRKNSSQFPHVFEWMKSQEFESTLQRATIDVDFMPDVWLSTSFLKQSYVASTFGVLNPFATLLHHINVGQKGKYWDYDGMSYNASSKRGRDLFLSMPTLRIDHHASSPFGGINPLQSSYSQELGEYRYGFHGTEKQWGDLYHGKKDLSAVVFPPAYVPAMIAYQNFIRSPRAADSFDHWFSLGFPSMGLKGPSVENRLFRKREIQGLPRSLDLIGIILHMAEDMAVPQHTKGTVDLCHVDLEAMIDQEACMGAPISPDELEKQTEFINGTFDQENRAMISCQKLYQPDLVQSILHSDLASKWKMGDVQSILVDTALTSSQWSFSKEFLGKFKMIFPNGRTFRATSCAVLLNSSNTQELVKNAILYQYNLSVAASVFLMEKVITDYEWLEPL